MGEISLSEAAEDQDFDLTDKNAVSECLKKKVITFSCACTNGLLRWWYFQVNELIGEADKIWDERNQQAVAQGEEELPRMLPLIRLKVVQIIPFVTIPV